MIPALRPPALALALLLVLPAAPGAATDGTPAPTLNLRGVELTAFIQDVAHATGTTFIVDPQVRGKVDIVRDRPLDNEELIGVLLTVLRSNGLAAVPAGPATYRVVPDEAAARQPDTPLGFATGVYTLQRIDARAAAETLKPLVGRGGMVLALPRGNRLLVADYADNLRRIRALIERIDHDTASIDTVGLRNTGAREMAATLSELYGAGGQEAPLSVLAVESSNSVLLRGQPQLVQRAAKTALDLDARAERNGDIDVIRLRHASAEQLLPVLQQLVGQTPDTPAATDSGSASASAPVTLPAAGAAASDTAHTQVIAPANGKRPVIVRYPGANALILHADPDTRRTLLRVIDQLDVRREQVLVEALVVEVSDEAARQLGSQLVVAGTDGTVPVAVTQFANDSTGIVSLAGGALANRDSDDDDSLADTAREAAASALLGLSGGLIGLAGRSGDQVFGLIINAVKSDTRSQLLSTPSILTLDNEEAHILVGQEVPVTTGEVLSANNDNPFRTVDRKDVGIQLTVRPQINSGGGITLAIKQEVSSVSGTLSSASDELVLNKREIETRVVVDDGAIVSLGGLLDHSEQSRADKIPLLGDIPGLGALFRSKSRSRSQTNLMVFLRPRIIRDGDDARRQSAQRYDYLRRNGLHGDPQAVAELEALVRDYLHATPPQAPSSPTSRTAPAATPPAPRP